MQVNANAPDTILSLLLEVANCTFVRVTEFKKIGHIRHQFGDIHHASYINGATDNTHAELIKISAEHPHSSITLQFSDYQFTLSILSAQHAHIECRILFNSDSLPYSSKAKDLFATQHKIDKLVVSNNSLTNQRRAQDDKAVAKMNENHTRIVIDLVHNLALPEFIVNLASQIKADYEKQDTWLPSVLFKTLCVSIESLRLIDHYVELTSDSLTKLRSRAALQTGIDEKIQRSSMTLCMVHCTDFMQVNRKFGQAQGDIVLHEIAHVIEEHTRSEDICGRFGGALFGVAINANTPEDGFILASKLQTALHNKVYLQNATRLTFNIGLAFVSQEEDQIDTASTSSLLINRAEQALKAAQNTAKPSIVQWEPDKFRLDEQEFNYVGGIFTPDNVTNYRNMLLLWDISSIIADEHTFERLLKSVIERLAFTFEFAYAGIISLSDDSSETNTKDNEYAQNYSFELQNATDIVALPWEEYPHKLLVHKTAKLALKNALHTKTQEDGFNTLVIPLGNESSECFFIMGHSKLIDLTHDTVMLFVGFARQLGKAFRRSQLEDQLNRNLEQQNAKLSQELSELKAGMQSSALVYRSPKMQKIIEQTQRAAQTDTTVLITGESGTGKEKLINAIHALSPRNEKPLIIVDCGSIPETLIESELFGHIKGAFTGAQSNNIGKIQAAHGGILVLDEIGELPLSMQPKLLRFVQEKHFTPVGGNKSSAVDVKIVAVTNRDLAFEVSQGNFRKDLFYRLNVVTLHNPPLRERTEDIDLLCQHFLSKFARQFEMDKKYLSSDTLTLMRRYSWPGNIRELENKLMQASLLTTTDEISYADLDLEPQHSICGESVSIHQAPEVQFQSLRGDQGIERNDIALKNYGHNSFRKDDSVDIDSPNGYLSNNNSRHSPSDETALGHPLASQSIPFDKLAGTLSAQQWRTQFVYGIDNLLASLSKHAMLNSSLGDSVELTLLNMAQKERGSHAKTAVLLQLPTSTARRKLQKSPPNVSLFEADENWSLILGLLNDIVTARVQLESPVDIVRQLVAKCILKLHASNMALASQLMGVSEPTMYKLRKQLQQTNND